MKHSFMNLRALKVYLTACMAGLASFSYAQENSLDFDGTDDYVNITSYKGVTGTDARTIEAWVKVPANSAEQPIVSWGANAAGEKFTFGTDGAGRLYIDANGGYKTGSTDLRDDSWHHVAISWENDGTPDINEAMLYVDGAEEIIAGQGSEPVNTASDADVRIGTDFNNRFHSGCIDEVRIWNVARTQSEIINNQCDITNPTSEANLVAYYKMNQASGTAVTDGSSSGNNGTMTNMDGNTDWVAHTCDIVEANEYFPSLSTKMTENYPIEMPEMHAYPIYINSDIHNGWGITIDSVQVMVGDTTITATEEGGYYFAWWTPTEEGAHEVTIRSYASNGNHTDEVLNMQVNTGYFSRSEKTFDGDLIDWNHASRWFYGTYELPQSVGAYKEIIANFSVTCPDGPDGCDDWDRLGYVEYKAPDGTWMELFRYITPYGVACDHEIDLTDYASVLNGKLELRMFIDTWGTGGWELHLDFQYNKGTPEYLYSSIQELWHGYYSFGNPANMAPLDTVAVNFADGVEAAKLRVVTTGHGWGENNTGNAAEFYNATHAFLVNNNVTFTQNLWNDCNPNPDGCTGQQGTWQYNRAGWCPGAIAPPSEFDCTNLIGQAPFNLAYIFQQSYVDQCHPNSPGCVSGVTCPNCNDGYNPSYQVGGYMISYSSKTESPQNVNGIAESLEFDFTVYPNPSNGLVRVQLGTDIGQCVLTVNDITGATVRNYFFDNQNELDKYVFDLSDLNKGIYFINIQNEQQSSSQKIVLH